MNIVQIIPFFLIVILSFIIYRYKGLKSILHFCFKYLNIILHAFLIIKQNRLIFNEMSLLIKSILSVI